MSDPWVTKHLEVDVTCLNCGTAAGLLRRELGATQVTTMFQDGAGGAPLAVGRPGQLRCTRCGGALYADDVRVIDIYKPGPHETPRRGRPRKHPV